MDLVKVRINQKYIKVILYLKKKTQYVFPLSFQFVGFSATTFYQSSQPSFPFVLLFFFVLSSIGVLATDSFDLGFLPVLVAEVVILDVAIGFVPLDRELLLLEEEVGVVGSISELLLPVEVLRITVFGLFLVGDFWTVPVVIEEIDFRPPPKVVVVVVVVVDVGEIEESEVSHISGSSLPVLPLPTLGFFFGAESVLRSNSPKSISAPSPSPDKSATSNVPAKSDVKESQSPDPKLESAVAEELKKI